MQDISAALEDESDSDSQFGLVSVPLLQAITHLGRAAVSSGTLKLKPNTSSIQKEALEFLKLHGFADSNNILLPSALSATTTIKDPAFVENHQTAYGRRQFLLGSGWVLATSGRQASLGERLLHPNQCIQYYRLLMDFHLFMQKQEDCGWLSHCQGEHYYNTLLTAFESRDDLRYGIRIISHHFGFCFFRFYTNVMKSDQ